MLNGRIAANDTGRSFGRTGTKPGSVAASSSRTFWTRYYIRNCQVAAYTKSPCPSQTSAFPSAPPQFPSLRSQSPLSLNSSFPIMNPRSSSDPDILFELNRHKLKKVFSKHFPNKEGRITFSEFTRFCKNSRIHPDLVTMLELKRIIARLTSATQTSKITLAYAQFEHSLKHIAVATFNSTIPLEDKLRMLLLHIKNPCKQEYQVSLACDTEDSRPASHLSELEDSDDSRVMTNSRVSLGTSMRAPSSTHLKTTQTLKVTLDLANPKSPLSYANHARHKYFSMSPTRERQGSLNALAKLTPVLAKKSSQAGALSPVEIPIDTPASPFVKVKLPITPSEHATAVPLFHVSLDKHKKREGRSTEVNDKHSRTLSAGNHLLTSPRFGVNNAKTGEIVAFPETEVAGKGYSLVGIQGKVMEFTEKFESWKDFAPKVIGRPLRTVLRKQREFIEQTTANWFPGVRLTQDFVVRAILRSWRHYAGRKAAKRLKSVQKPV